MGLSIDKISRVVSYDAAGCDCQFYEMTDEIGLKVYHNHEIGRKAYALQKLAYLNGLGPKPGRRFIGRNYFAYFTEILTVISEQEFYCNNNDDEDDGYYDEYGFQKRIYHPDNRFHSVYLRLREIGIVDNDGHNENYGFDKNGELKLLDFGGFGQNTKYFSHKRRLNGY